MSAGSELSVVVATTTQLVSHIQALHGTAPTATAALGRACSGALLMTQTKGGDEQTLSLRFNGGGPLGNLRCVAQGRFVKGFVDEPACDPPLRSDGKLNVGAAVGTAGVLTVVRQHPQLPPYTGAVELQSGEVADDLAFYLSTSEQVNSALALGVSIGRDLSVTAAGGYLIAVLPFASDATLSRLEANLATLPSVTAMINAGLDAAGIAARLLDGIGEAPGIAELVPAYGPCEPADLEERMQRAVVALGRQEIASIMEQEGKIEVSCPYCVTKLLLDGEALIKRAVAEKSAAI